MTPAHGSAPIAHARPRTAHRRATTFIAGVGILFGARGAVADTTVTGRVTDHRTGEPVAALRLSIDYQPFPFIVDEIGAAVTDADGRYVWSGVCPSPFSGCFVVADDAAYLPAQSPSFDANATSVSVDFALIESARIEGDLRVDGAMPDGPSDVAVEYLGEDGQWTTPIGPIKTETDGHYAFDRLPPHVQYRVCAGGLDVGTLRQCWDHHDQSSLAAEPAFDAFALDEGAERAAIDFDLATAGHVGGVVHDAWLGTSLAHRDIGIGFTGIDGAFLGTAYRTTDDVGAWRVDGVPDGTYYFVLFVVDGDGFIDGTQVFPGIACPEEGCPPATEGDAVIVANGTASVPLDMTVHPDVVVAGRVVDAATGDGIGGVPIWKLSAGFPETASEDGSGAYHFYASHRNLAFTVLARDAPPYIDQVYPSVSCIGNDCLTQGQFFAPETGAVFDHVDFALDLGASIAGRITDHANGAPLGGAYVQLYDAGYTPIWGGFADDDGDYASAAWTPGTYYVSATVNADCMFFDARPCSPDGNPASASPTPVATVLGEVRNGVDIAISADFVFANGFDR